MKEIWDGRNFSNRFGNVFASVSVDENEIFQLLFQVKERPDVGVYVKDLSAYVCNNADDMDRIMTIGNKNSKYIWDIKVIIIG